MLQSKSGLFVANVYAARAREGLPVSVPIFREEIVELKSAARWNIANLHERLDVLAGDDPWAEVANTKQLIKSEMRQRIGMKQKEYNDGQLPRELYRKWLGTQESRC
ncbi:hypothetical protein [Pseudomonas sp.]|uniref:non-homologous end-joining DNA ligase LigD n=1 Tax=Pseudomonas TaxID=286 RepID=UPI00338F2062